MVYTIYDVNMGDGKTLATLLGDDYGTRMNCPSDMLHAPDGLKLDSRQNE